MQVFRYLPYRAPASGLALTIGNFDGVHRGHQAVLAHLAKEAGRRGLPSAVMSFEPHPREYFAAQAGRAAEAPARILPLRDKLTALAAQRVDLTFLLRFDARLAALSAQDFIHHILVERLRVRWLLVGDDFHFGAGRRGNEAMLREAAPRAGFEVAGLPSVQWAGERVSSSALRRALAAGEMERVHAMLGRPYSLSGHVVHGRKLGRELGTPTLNLRLGGARLAAEGIYVARVWGLDPPAGPQPAAPRWGVASLGRRPTIEAQGPVLLETHILDWQGDAYGRCVRVELLHKLHEERRYDGLEALRAGIQADLAEARRWIASRLP